MNTESGAPDTADLQPDTDEVLQRETDTDRRGPVVPVCLVDAEVPVRTQTLPNKSAATKTVNVAAAGGSPAAQPVQVLTADHRRDRATLLAIGGNMYVAFQSAASQDPGRSALWPAGVPLVLTAVTDVWVFAATTAITVSVVTEMWAAGEGRP